MKRKLKFKKLGKKGGIPAVNEIVMTILNVTPKPILILIFILLVTTIATFVIPLFLNLFGYACVYENSNLELYQVPMSAIGTKSIQDIKSGLNELFGLPTYELPDDPFPTGTKEFIRIPDGCFETVNNGSEQIYGYTGLCVDCPVVSNYPFDLWFLVNKTSGIRYQQSICTGDGEPQATVWNKDLYGANFCYRCNPPTGYYYNHSNVADQGWVFTIEDISLIGLIDENYYYNVHLNRIKNLGGVKRSQDDTEFVNIQCTEFDQPSLYFFSVELFNRTMWIYLIVGWSLITFAFLYYNAIGLN